MLPTSALTEFCLRLLSLLALGHDFLARISILKPRRWLILLAESFTEFIPPCPAALGAGSPVHVQHFLACLKIQILSFYPFPSWAGPTVGIHSSFVFIRIMEGTFWG